MATNDRRDDRPVRGGPNDSDGVDERRIPLDIRETRDHPDVDEQVEGFQRIIGPGAGTAADRPAEDDFGIPGSEEEGGLGTGPLPPRQPDHPQRPAGRPDGLPDDRIVSDRNVAVDGARDGR
ncbi:hypothetical protein [Azospirillum picis]|uniref:Uncharacterized protein n=1 Tax=Azospirillum picis TaxID=488438 RepID=A0ABU0MGH2_9PROT|nr:hypothetical protein [Azospirillum picis]MBP2298401.1 hypothetical protein [Azospirillum picis]MDQ0532550.1 hypothetical protein [Azospirillum picis]